MGIQIAPSILSADFSRLAEEAAAVASADWLHIDVMDNHFVPNLTIGLPVVEALRKVSPLPLDCHLMIEDPDRWAPGYAEAGAGSVTFHVEAAHAPVRLARELRRTGARAGMALKPATPVEPYEDLLPELDLLLLMTVEPGFGGQAFLDVVLPKLRRARAMVDRCGTQVWLQVDGGVSLETVGRCVEAGADVLVAGSAVYGADDPDAAVAALRAAAASAAVRAPTRLVDLEPHAGTRLRHALTSSDLPQDQRGDAAAGRAWHTSGDSTNSSRAPGSVQVRTGGDSPRPGRSHRPVDQVELLDRR